MKTFNAAPLKCHYKTLHTNWSTKVHVHCLKMFLSRIKQNYLSPGQIVHTRCVHTPLKKLSCWFVKF